VAGCQACHEHDGRSTPPDTGVHGDGAVDFGGPLMSADFTYTEGFDDAGCTTNPCHDVGQPGDWKRAAGADTCRHCHDAGDAKLLGKGTRPFSGLHVSTGGGAASRTVHGGQFPASPAEEGPGSANCVTCHTSNPSARHVDGTLQERAPVVTVSPAVGFVASPARTCAPVGPLADCHAGGAEGRLRSWGSEPSGAAAPDQK
jgi:hypothetical protein